MTFKELRVGDPFNLPTAVLPLCPWIKRDDEYATTNNGLTRKYIEPDRKVEYGHKPRV